MDHGNSFEPRSIFKIFPLNKIGPKLYECVDPRNRNGKIRLSVLWKRSSELLLARQQFTW
jgi:hypothetical protein